MIWHRLGSLVALPCIAALMVTSVANARARSPCVVDNGMAFVPAGYVSLGQDADASTGRKVSVAGFWIDKTEVTVARFAAFVATTGYRTQAERDGSSAVFVAPDQLSGDSPAQWWRLVHGASWRFPQGPTKPPARLDEPVVQVTLEDAQAFARWAKRELPSEAEWELAARGGDTVPHTPEQWAYDQQGKPKANTWQGFFPIVNDATDGYAGVAPVGCFAPNGYGIYDMIGNVWELTLDRKSRHPIIKGGSYLCALNYCSNFKPAARLAQEQNLGTSHIGFRTITRLGK